MKEPSTSHEPRRRESAAEPIRVLHVIPGEAQGASMIFARRQVASLGKTGVVVDSFFLGSRMSVRQLLEEHRRFRRRISEFEPDLIHAHYGTMTAFFCVVSTSVPLVVTYRGSDMNPSAGISTLRSMLGRFLSQLTALRARRIICVSDAIRQRLWWRRSIVTTIPSGIDTVLFRPMPRDEARSALGWGTADKVILFNANDPAVKRLDLAQASVEAASRLCGELRLEILDGRVAPDLMPTLMNAADCLLITSDWEGSPNVVKEAMATNLPVVSVDVGDVALRLKSVSPSWIVSRDSQDLGVALADALSSRLRSNGFDHVQEFSLEKVASDIRAVYRDALATNARFRP